MVSAQAISMRRLTRFFAVAIIVGTSTACIGSLSQEGLPQDETGVFIGNEQNNGDGENDETYPLGDTSSIVSHLPVPSDEILRVQLSETETSISNSLCKFSFAMLSHLYSGESLVISPLSVSMALSILTEGANGESAEEILEVMGIEANQAFYLKDFYCHLLEQLPAVDTTVRINTLNALVADVSVPLLDSYKSDIRKYYFSEVRNMNFSRYHDVCELINGWCYETTNGLIPSILNEEECRSSIAVLLNLLYMKAAWMHPFDKSHQIKKQELFRRPGMSPCTVDYLTTVETMEYLEANTFRAARRELGRKGQYCFTVLLPRSDAGVKEEVLDALSSRDSKLDLSSFIPREVSLRLPVFATESSYQLIDCLMSLGIKKIFTPEADFSRMVFPGYPFEISSIFHRVTMTIDPDGIEGAAATMVQFGGTTNGNKEEKDEPICFWADHPFVYMITEKASGAILFAGVFNGV
jgi:serpin B